MSLETGQKLAHYEILTIGKGGMREVYRVRDGKLDRDVAMKVLAEEFSQSDPRRRSCRYRHQDFGIVGTRVDASSSFATGTR